VISHRGVEAHMNGDCNERCGVCEFEDAQLCDTEEEDE
jgi:hypothetical protein